MKLKFGASVKTRCLIVNHAPMIELRVATILSRKNIIKSNTGFSENQSTIRIDDMNSQNFLMLDCYARKGSI